MMPRKYKYVIHSDLVMERTKKDYIYGNDSKEQFAYEVQQSIRNL